jgi:hypothetical protein
MIKLVAIRVLFNEEGKQTCDTGDETCHFYVSFQSSHWCNHCQRGITNSVPHRLCPLNDPAHMGPQEFARAVLAKSKEKNGITNYAHSLMVKCFNEGYDKHLEKKYA